MAQKSDIFKPSSATQKNAVLNDDIVACRACPRLVSYCRIIGEKKRAAYRDEMYWSKPVPNFGDADAEALIVGLAPGAHGSNRTGRMFTGDASGEWLFRVLHQSGFASQPTASAVNDGLTLKNLLITAVCHCAPPDNKPDKLEIQQCRDFLVRTIAGLPKLRVVIALGRLAYDEMLGLARTHSYLFSQSDETIQINKKQHPFGHMADVRIGLETTLIASYHPSKQNTQTGKLSADALLKVFMRVQEILAQNRK